MIELSFVIPCFNSAETIQKTLNSIFSQKIDYSYEVIVVDNGSEDKTLEIVKQFSVQLFVELKRGANHARNTGLRNSKGKYVAFVDSDVVLEDNWAQNLLSYIRKKSLLAAQGKIILRPFKNPDSLLERYRCSVTSLHPANWIGLVTTDYKVGHINTAACIYKAQTLKSVQGFSNTIRIHEDVDLCLKVRSLPNGAIGSTASAVAYCYYTKDLISYLKRAFIHGYFLARVSKKWNFKKFRPSHQGWESINLFLLDRLLYIMTFLGLLLGKGILKIYAPKEYIKECWQMKKIASIPKVDIFKVYFEDTELNGQC